MSDVLPANRKLGRVASSTAQAASATLIEMFCRI
jgi:hypothetical protein